MAKKILILENSSTIQKLFTKTLESGKFTVKFSKKAKEVFNLLLDFNPDLFLLNSDIQEPKSFEIVKIVRSIKVFKNLTIGMYSNIPTTLDEVLAKDCGVNTFIRLDSETLEDNIEELVETETGKTERISSKDKKPVDDAMLFMNASSLLSSSSYKNAMLSKIVNMVDNIESIEEMIKPYLLMIAEVCEVPLAALYILENAGPQGYYVCAQQLEEKEINEFLNVCIADFQKNNPDCNTSKINTVRLDSQETLDRFYRAEVQLSSYECKILKSRPHEKDKPKNLGTVHIVSEGNITSEKQNYLEFWVQTAGEVFAKALIIEKKVFFEKRIRRAFSRFVPEQIIDNLVMQADNTDEKIGVGETRAVAILFSDIRSFTNISEKNRADVLVAFLNRYFSTMVEIIKKHGGTIDKFIGDAIMAEFGTPVSYEDNCRRAVMAAYEMRDALETVEMGDLVMPEGMKFNIGIGIHYGDVIVGSIGSKDKTDYSFIGDNVNLASRLEGLTKTYGTQILVSESVRDDVITSSGENAFCFRHLDDVRVKGKKNAVPIYAVDRNEKEFPASYKDAYIKGMELYVQGIWNLAKDYFVKALDAVHEDKAAKLMLERCEEFIKNPPENWDGAIAFMTK